MIGSVLIIVLLVAVLISVFLCVIIEKTLLSDDFLKNFKIDDSDEIT